MATGIAAISEDGSSISESIKLTNLIETLERLLH